MLARCSSVMRGPAACGDGGNAAGLGRRTLEHVGQPGFHARQHALQSAAAGGTESGHIGSLNPQSSLVQKK